MHSINPKIRNKSEDWLSFDDSYVLRELKNRKRNREELTAHPKGEGVSSFIPVKGSPAAGVCCPIVTPLVFFKIKSTTWSKNIWLRSFRSKNWWAAIHGSSSKHKKEMLGHFQSKKGKGAHHPKAQTVRAYPGFISMKHLGVLLLPLDGMLVHRRVTLLQQFVAATYLYTWVKRDN